MAHRGRPDCCGDAIDGRCPAGAAQPDGRQGVMNRHSVTTARCPVGVAGRVAVPASDADVDEAMSTASCSDPIRDASKRTPRSLRRSTTRLKLSPTPLRCPLAIRSESVGLATQNLSVLQQSMRVLNGPRCTLSSWGHGDPDPERISSPVADDLFTLFHGTSLSAARRIAANVFEVPTSTDWCATSETRCGAPSGTAMAYDFGEGDSYRMREARQKGGGRRPPSSMDHGGDFIRHQRGLRHGP